MFLYIYLMIVSILHQGFPISVTPHIVQSWIFSRLEGIAAANWIPITAKAKRGGGGNSADAIIYMVLVYIGKKWVRVHLPRMAKQRK